MSFLIGLKLCMIKRVIKRVSVKLSTHRAKRAKVIELELIILILRLFIFTTLRNLI